MCLDLLVLSSLVSNPLHNPGENHITDLWNSSFPGCLSSFSASQLSPTLWDPRTAACQASLSNTNSRRLLKIMSIELATQSNHLILCQPLLLKTSIFPSIRVFPMSHFFASRGQSIQVSASALVFLMNIKDWSLVGWTSCISSQSKGHSKNIISNNTVQMNPFFRSQPSLWSNLLNHTWLEEKQ